MSKKIFLGYRLSKKQTTLSLYLMIFMLLVVAVHCDFDRNMFVRIGEHTKKCKTQLFEY